MARRVVYSANDLCVIASEQRERGNPAKKETGLLRQALPSSQ
jgi:hypothetical protein